VASFKKKLCMKSKYENLLLIFLVVSIVLFVVSAIPLPTGQIVKKEYHPPCQEEVTLAAPGFNQRIPTVTPFRVPKKYPERWSIDLIRKSIFGDTLRGMHYVSKELFDSLSVGTFITVRELEAREVSEH
jgi:hypothetical protein